MTKRSLPAPGTNSLLVPGTICILATRIDFTRDVRCVATTPSICNGLYYTGLYHIQSVLLYLQRKDYSIQYTINRSSIILYNVYCIAQTVYSIILEKEGAKLLHVCFIFYFGYS